MVNVSMVVLIPSFRHFSEPAEKVFLFKSRVECGFNLKEGANMQNTC